MSRTVLMVAGEASGDALGAALASALLRADPGLHIYGVGGPAMREAGVYTIVDTSALSVMGLAEMARDLGRVLGILRRLRRELRERRPDLFVPIDFPDFNLPLCRTARRLGVPVFYYVSPQVWAWRRGRLRTIARTVTRMLVLFPFEAGIYRGLGIDARFVGHPLADAVAPTKSREQVREALGLRSGDRLVALLPGSRRREVDAMLPPMAGAVAAMGPSVRGVVAEAASLPPGYLEVLLARTPGGSQLQRRRGETHDLLAAADAALVTSGTATLEAALLGCPMVVAYRMAPLSYALARRLVSVPFIAMPNLLLGREVVPELVQHDASAAQMAERLGRILGDEGLAARMRRDFDEIRAMLVQPGAADRAAALALETAR